MHTPVGVVLWELGGAVNVLSCGSNVQTPQRIVVSTDKRKVVSIDNRKE